MKISVNGNIDWVGKIDWELKKFHGDEYSTHKGSTYNSYLVRGEKTALIDTVWRPFAGEYIRNLRSVIDPDRIDFIIANHGEVDHSGALPELMKLIPGRPVYCTANAVKSLRGQYHQDWNFQVVKTGDRLSLGDRELIFIEAAMLHWPENMMCYLTGDNVLFSNDAFGQHYASEFMFNELVDQGELFAECIKYYANILTPFSSMVAKKISEVLALNLSVDCICPSHGVIWRKDPLQIVKKYQEWADAYRENRISIVYDSMWENTRLMAEAIVSGIREADPSVNVKLFNVAGRDKNDLIVEIFRSKAVLFGSSTINNGILSGMAGIMEEIRGLRFKGKKAASFGSYGWSGESVKMLNELAVKAGFEVVSEGIRVMWTPDEKAAADCADFGKKFAADVR
jgi:flavorubredoxin